MNNVKQNKPIFNNKIKDTFDSISILLIIIVMSLLTLFIVVYFAKATTDLITESSHKSTYERNINVTGDFDLDQSYTPKKTSNNTNNNLEESDLQKEADSLYNNTKDYIRYLSKHVNHVFQQPISHGDIPILINNASLNDSNILKEVNYNGKTVKSTSDSETNGNIFCYVNKDSYNKMIHSMGNDTTLLPQHEFSCDHAVEVLGENNVNFYINK